MVYIFLFMDRVDLIDMIKKYTPRRRYELTVS